MDWVTRAATWLCRLERSLLLLGCCPGARLVNRSLCHWSCQYYGHNRYPILYCRYHYGVFISSFASTSLDSATRIQRYLITEIFAGMNIKAFENRFLATAFAVGSAALLAFASGADGKGALALWPLFGAINQTLAALALIVITIYLEKREA